MLTSSRFEDRGRRATVGAILNEGLEFLEAAEALGCAGGLQASSRTLKCGQPLSTSPGLTAKVQVTSATKMFRSSPPRCRGAAKRLARPGRACPRGEDAAVAVEDAHAPVAGLRDRAVALRGLPLCHQSSETYAGLRSKRGGSALRVGPFREVLASGLKIWMRSSRGRRRRCGRPGRPRSVRQMNCRGPCRTPQDASARRSGENWCTRQLPYPVGD